MATPMYDKIKSDMRSFMKNKEEDTTSLLKVLISDIQRDPHKDYSDAKCMIVIRQTIKNLEMSDDYENACDADFLKNYLPKETSKDEIKVFLKSIDFAKLKSPNQAIGMVIKHFPEGTVNGKVVTELLQDIL